MGRDRLNRNSEGQCPVATLPQDRVSLWLRFSVSSGEPVRFQVAREARVKGKLAASWRQKQISSPCTHMSLTSPLS